MSETRTVVAVARPPHGVGQAAAAVLPRRPDRAPVLALRPHRGDGADERGEEHGEEPAPSASGDAGRTLRGRAGHCRIAMQYLD
ncbi:hypothetical protein [Kitasatospora sp. NBC_00458]|uniref:hypothetical protein n=1 Tax=Kitasatospora sp. NBC_00458 TaxID=2903568 RepID=UPI002E19091F